MCFRSDLDVGLTTHLLRAELVVEDRDNGALGVEHVGPLCDRALFSRTACALLRSPYGTEVRKGAQDIVLSSF